MTFLARLVVSVSPCWRNVAPVDSVSYSVLEYRGRNGGMGLERLLIALIDLQVSPFSLDPVLTIHGPHLLFLLHEGDCPFNLTPSLLDFVHLLGGQRQAPVRGVFDRNSF